MLLPLGSDNSAPPCHGLPAQSFDGQQLCECCWALAKLRWVPAPLWLSRFAECLGGCVDSLRPGEVAMAMWGLAQIR